MLPIKSFGGASSLPNEGVRGALSATDAGETRQLKPKTLPCKFCSKRFRRVEHVQRHERTHTKEKPFSCDWERCGKTFGRRDLLVRHEKLVHLNESNKDASRSRRQSGTSNHRASLSDGQDGITSGQVPGLPAQQQHMSQPHHPSHHQPQLYHHAQMNAVAASPMESTDHRMPPRAVACNLDLLSDAALASEVSPMQPPVDGTPQRVQDHSRMKAFAESVSGFPDRQRDEPQQHMTLQPPGFPPPPNPAPYDDYNVFMDDFASSTSFLPPHFEPDQQMGMWPRLPAISNTRDSSKPASQFSSRFGSLAPEGRENMDGMTRMHEDHRPPSLRISVVDHTVIKNRLDEFSTVLPSDFVFPSRHTLTRFLEGYISGFHEQLPFLHLPTFSPVDAAPELILAVLAVGAQYRFEHNRGYALWYAAKSVAMEQIRRRLSTEMHALLPTAAAYSPHSTRPSPSASYRHSFASAQSERPTTQDTHREPYSPNTPQARLETIQAVLLLFAVGLWGAKTVLHEALSLQSNLAILIREEGLIVETGSHSLGDWEAWIRFEGATRTKLIAYCFFNLCSTVYNMPPLLLTSELHMFLPLRSRLWRAENAWQWQELRQSTALVEITVHDAFSRLFGRSNQGLPTQISSLGNYVMIHALLQHIYLLKQTSIAAGPPYDVQRSLKPEDVEEVTSALRVWQTNFEHRRQLRSAESGHLGAADSTMGGSLAYNATALLRLAFIRLYTDISPSRSLETRDSMLVASALSTTAPLVRSLRLHRAVFQAVHALSMLVKAGVNYVARTKTSEWSIQHSLCNFECAILLAKWLLTLAAITASDPPASPEERNLLEMIRRMLDETEFAVPVDPSLSGPGIGVGGGLGGQMEMVTSDRAKLRQLASAVVRLWAETFKGTHIFDMVKVMGSSLDGYADLVNKPRERTPPLARMAPQASM